jgi:histidinol-phosphatase (PHP family)
LFKHNFHTHTSYCDGSSKPEQYVLEAIKAGLDSIGFSGHAPVPFENNYAIEDIQTLSAYCDDINGLKEKYKDEINILLALEADFIPGITMEFSVFRKQFSLDYIIGSVHLVKNAEGELWFIDGSDRNTWLRGFENGYRGDIKKAVKNYYQQVNEMVTSQNPDVVGHLDKVKMHNRGEFFREDEGWYISLLSETLELIKEGGCIVEVNTRGLYKKRSDSLFPGAMALREMRKLNIPVTISSDAHKPVEVALMLDETASALLEKGYKEAYIYTGKAWEGIPL